MRALIRASIVTHGTESLPDRADREKYDAAIVKLLQDVGFDPRTVSGSSSVPTPEQLAESPEVRALFENLQGTIVDEEKKHLVMLGYAGSGQALFVVCAINQNEIHIRVRDDLFEKLRAACTEICTKVWSHARRRRSLWSLRRRESSFTLRLADQIDVMEPNHKSATIKGRIIYRPLLALFKYHRTATRVALATSFLAAVLFVYAPAIAPRLAAGLSWLRAFDPLYVQGTLERVFSAFLVTFFISLLELFLTWRDYHRRKPVVWNAGIEPSTETTNGH